MSEQIQGLYKNWIAAWNAKNASAMAQLVANNGTIIGFDGSEMKGPAAVLESLGKIFRDYPTGEYVSIIKEIRPLAQEVFLVRAVVGMVPRGFTELNPAVNAIQSLVAILVHGKWQISHFQNTPAAFHLEPDLGRQMTEELNAQYKKNGVG